MEDLRELYEAAVNRSEELEAENADLSASVARAAGNHPAAGAVQRP